MSRVRREESFRGISTRLAVHYLTNLGGEVVADERVEATDGTWAADLSTDRVSIGPSLSLTEVTVAFEGEADELDEVIERFSQKAMRAGG